MAMGEGAHEPARRGPGLGLFFVIAPGSIAGYGPWAISGWRVRAVSPALQVFDIDPVAALKHVEARR